MFCTNCGKELNDGTIVCPGCGNKMGEPAPTTGINGTNEDDLTVHAGGKSVKVSLIVKTVSLCLIVLFFFPLFTVSCSYSGYGSSSISVTGLQSLIGKTIRMMGEEGRIDGKFIAIFLLLIPAAIAAVIFMKKSIKQLSGKLYMATGALAVVGFIFQFIYRSVVRSEVLTQGEEMVTVRFSFWYFLGILLYLVIAAISFLCVQHLSKRKSNLP